MKKAKRVLSTLLVCCLVVGLMPLSTRAYEMGMTGLETTISAASNHSLAIKDDGSLWVWGKGELGFVGKPNMIMDGVVTACEGDTGYGAIIYAIKTDGSLWVRSLTEITINGTTIGYNPQKIMDNVKTVDTSGRHTLAIKKDGSLWAWGNNSLGQLGDGTTETRDTPVKIMDNVLAVSAGTSCSFIIDKDKNLWELKVTPTKIQDNVMAVSSGNGHTLSLKEDGSLWTWGNNETPVKIMDNVNMISAGMSHSVAITKDGSLWSWGCNSSGELGDGTTTNANIPVKVMDDVVSVSAGSSHTLAVKKDGSLWSWGSNVSGELGNGSHDATSHSTPTKIMEGVKLPVINSEIDEFTSVYFLNGWDTTTRTVKFGDSAFINPDTYAVADGVDVSNISSLLNKYVLVTMEQGDSSLEYTITDIQPVESKIGTVSATGEHSLTIDGTTYPVREDYLLGAHDGQEFLYHISNGTIMGFDVLEEKTGTLEAWDSTTGRVIIDGQVYPTNYISNIESIDELLGTQVYFSLSVTSGYTPLIKVSAYSVSDTLTISKITPNSGAIYPQAITIYFGSAVQLGTGYIWLKDIQTDKVLGNVSIQGQDMPIDSVRSFLNKFVCAI